MFTPTSAYAQLTSAEVAVIAAIAGGTYFVDEENLATQGSGPSFTLAKMPVTGSVHLFRGGSRQQVAAGDYSISGQTVTLAAALSSGEGLLADYRTLS